MKTLGKERRQKERLNGYHLIKYRVAASGGQSAAYALTSVVNICSGGVLFKPSEPLAIGTVVDIKINFPGLPEPLITQAKVIRSKEVKAAPKYYETGVKFIDIDEEKGKIIDKIIKFVNIKIS